MKGKVYWRVETERYYYRGFVVEHMLHDADVVAHYEIVNAYIPRMVFRWIGIAHVILTSEQLDSIRSQRIVFSLK